MRVVVDTNILVSFAIRPNPDFEKLFDYLAAHGLTLVSEETIAELFAVLSRDAFRTVAACRDPNDDKFLSLAIAGNADCIVSGDTDLLEMVAYRGIPVYRAAEFLRLFAESKPQ